MSKLPPLSLIKKFINSEQELEQARARLRQLSEQVDTSRYSPSSLARAATLSPAAQRGFSESLVSTRSPFAVELMRPSVFLKNTPPLASRHDKDIVDYLARSISKDKLRDLPSLWIDENPEGLYAGYEGRHRMTALNQLYGDDPVPITDVMGSKYSHSPYGRNFEGELKISPLEMLKRKLMFGEQQHQINPLWMRDQE